MPQRNQMLFVDRLHPILYCGAVRKYYVGGLVAERSDVHDGCGYWTQRL